MRVFGYGVQGQAAVYSAPFAICSTSPTEGRTSMQPSGTMAMSPALWSDSALAQMHWKLACNSERAISSRYCPVAPAMPNASCAAQFADLDFARTLLGH